MIWHALPPEVNTGRLMAGAGPAPMLQAAAGWEALAISLETQADELAAGMVALASNWTGAAGERAVAAFATAVAWLRTVSAQCHKRSAQAAAQAAAYSKAMATTPPLAEIEQNHVTRAVLYATNFLGINTIPIGINEFDYFVRMWNQAAGTMDLYQAETAMNIVFEPIMPLTPLTVPGLAQGAAAQAMGEAAAAAPATALRNLVFTQVSAQAAVGTVVMQAERAASQGHRGAQSAETRARQAEATQQGTQLGTQMVGQVVSGVAQLPQQATQLINQSVQQLTQPLQQVSSIFGRLGAFGGERAQLGLLGASPFSNHPLAGGSGPAAGAGLVRAASIPGAGGTGPTTALVADLLGGRGTERSKAVPVGAMTAATGAGRAPVGPGAPVGITGQRVTGGGNKAGLKVPAPLRHDLSEDDDDW